MCMNIYSIEFKIHVGSWMLLVNGWMTSFTVEICSIRLKKIIIYIIFLPKHQLQGSWMLLVNGWMTSVTVKICIISK